MITDVDLCERGTGRRTASVRTDGPVTASESWEVSSVSLQGNELNQDGRDGRK